MSRRCHILCERELAEIILALSEKFCESDLDISSDTDTGNSSDSANPTDENVLNLSSSIQDVADSNISIEIVVISEEDLLLDANVESSPRDASDNNADNVSSEDKSYHPSNSNTL